MDGEGSFVTALSGESDHEVNHQRHQPDVDARDVHLQEVEQDHRRVSGHQASSEAQSTQSPHEEDAQQGREQLRDEVVRERDQIQHQRRGEDRERRRDEQVYRHDGLRQSPLGIPWQVGRDVAREYAADGQAQHGEDEQARERRGPREQADQTPAVAGRPRRRRVPRWVPPDPVRAYGVVGGEDQERVHEHVERHDDVRALHRGLGPTGEDEWRRERYEPERLEDDGRQRERHGLTARDVEGGRVDLAAPPKMLETPPAAPTAATPTTTMSRTGGCP